MAYQHITIALNSTHGRYLRNALSDLENARNSLRDIVAFMPTMVDGSDYTHLEEQFGLETGKGESAKNELESLMGKIDVDSSVTNTKAAIQQVFNLFA